MSHQDEGEDLVSSGMVAAEVGVPLSTLKLWERTGQVMPAFRIRGSDRRVWRARDLPELARQVSIQKARSNRRRAALTAA